MSVADSAFAPGVVARERSGTERWRPVTRLPQHWRGERSSHFKESFMTTSRNNLLLLSAITGLLAVNVAGSPSPAAAEDGKVKCYGANSCKGTGACGGKGHSCAGENACKGQGWIHTESEEACLKMEGGRLTAEPKTDSK
jgi:uncharacterized membrane protein